jgi:site-specific DNA recombinase
VTRFAFYGRVSTEDQQDPEASRQWQITRARALTEQHGEIVTEFFDIGLSRSLPWKRREQAGLLLEALRDPDRGFDAVVIGEPHRAFYGNQYSLVHPIFEHYGVALWVPEVGGPIDPTSEAHDLIMSVFGGMSKGERNRIKIRVRAAMASQAATEGRYLGGRPPYGYRLADAGPHPNPAKAADGKRLHRLEPDPAAAPIVRRIFAEYVNRKGIYAIAEGLTRDGIPCPSAHDPARNPHRTGVAWSKGAVKAILGNPRYTGRQVWNRQRKHEVLIDVEDVALGYETHLRWNDPQDWVWSATEAHEVIIPAEIFAEAERTRTARTHAQGPRHRQAVPHPYQLRGLLFCGICDRRMQGNWVRDTAYYRCRYPDEYALANHLAHPRNVLLHEAQIIPTLDSWIARAFEPSRLRDTVHALETAQLDGHSTDQVKAQKTIHDCTRKIRNYRAALDAATGDTAAVTIATWITEAEAERATAQAQLHAARHRHQMSSDEINALVSTTGAIAYVLRDADPAQKASLYLELGLKLIFRPSPAVLRVEARPKPRHVGVRYVSEGGLEPPRPIKGTSTSS